MEDILDDIPKDTFVDYVIYYSLVLAAIFQLACIFAAIFLPSTLSEKILDEVQAPEKSQSSAGSKTKQKADVISSKKSKQDKKRR